MSTETKERKMRSSRQVQKIRKILMDQGIDEKTALATAMRTEDNGAIGCCNGVEE